MVLIRAKFRLAFLVLGSNICACWPFLMMLADALKWDNAVVNSVNYTCSFPATPSHCEKGSFQPSRNT